MKWKELFTGRDNQTLDIGRVLWFECVQAFIGITVYLIWKGGELDLIEWGGAVAALLASGGAAIGMKANAEPDRNGNGIPDYLEDRYSERPRNKRYKQTDRGRDLDDDARGIEIDNPDEH